MAAKKKTGKAGPKAVVPRRRGPQGHLVDPGGLLIPPLPGLEPDPSENLFDTRRPGRAVVRPSDLVALRIELHNLVVDAGAPPRLRKAESGAAHLILHFPPQTVGEETFFQAAEKGTEKVVLPPGAPAKPEPPDGDSEDPGPPPVRARIGGESRLAFSVPDGFDVPYTLEGVLAACAELEPSVTAAARPPGAVANPLGFAELFTDDVARLHPARRAALTSFAARSLTIAALHRDTPTLHLRSAIGGPGLRPLAAGRLANAALDIGGVWVPGRRPVLRGPRPALPAPTQTAIELPWRLILSPHTGERWRHATVPVTSPAGGPGGGRTELWHTRLVALPPPGKPLVEPPKADALRTVRAVWARTGEGSSQPMRDRFPLLGDVPDPDTYPFRMPMDDRDRMEIAHLSSNFAKSGYTPNPVGANLLMLSSLGGWLDSRGAWEPPAGLSVEEWVHRGSMARDHAVRVVYKGFLLPFGFRVSLVKETERKFHNGWIGIDKKNGQPTQSPAKPGNAAYLRQRIFIIVRERERFFLDTQLEVTEGGKKRKLHRQLPYPRIRIGTEKTPTLDEPGSAGSRIDGFGQNMFWPCVGGQPFEFACVVTDLDGRERKFSLPMIFIDNTLANPAPTATRPAPHYEAAELHALAAQKAYRDPARAGRRSARFQQQRIAFAQSMKAGDTSHQAQEITFDVEVDPGNDGLRRESNRLQRPVFYPKVESAQVMIPALAHLTGSAKTNKVRWNDHYLAHGFDDNQGQVYLDVVAEPGMAQLDFSSQGDRAGGFVQPNLQPSALSRLTGPVAGNVGNFINGTMNGADAFPKTLSGLPLPLLFGCIPLGDVLDVVEGLAGKPEQVPKFASEASTQLESFVNALARLYDGVTDLASVPAHAVDGAIGAARHTLLDLVAQTVAYAPALVADARACLAQLQSVLDALAAQVQPLFDQTIDVAPALPSLPGLVVAAQTASANLRAAANAPVDGVSLPTGLRQSLLQITGVIDTLLGDVASVPVLIAQGQALFGALDAIVGQPQLLPDLLSNPAALKTRIEGVQAALVPLRATLATLRLLDGAPRQALVAAIDAVIQVLGGAGDLLELVEMLAGDELTLRFDWNPPLVSWGLKGANPPRDEALFRANDRRGFLVAVEAKVKKNGQSAPRISVVCSLKSFDLVLIAPASFIELNFEKIEFRVDSGAKMNVDVLLTDIKFVGPLSFVETLRDLIPLDGFSDPPYLDISPKGIDAGFSLALPSISIGVFNLSNLSLGAGFTVPFIGQPLAVRFNFCTREQPFNLTVCLFGGGGFFGITLDPSGVQILEASFEFGASLSVDLGVASGGVQIMAGIYFRMEKDACRLTGYFRLGGHVSVLGLITASIELYLELSYEPPTGKCAGIARLTVKVEIFMFSFGVTITVEKKFAGSNGDPTFRDLVGLQPTLQLADELALIDDTTEYAWREYAEAFA